MVKTKEGSKEDKFIEETVKGRIFKAKLSPLEDEIRKYILREFARNGRPPFPEEIMKGLRLSSVDAVNQTIEKPEKADILSRRGDKIASAYPFSTAKTRHKVIFEGGHVVYALCATDALGIHFMLEKDITILSKCPGCGKEIRIVEFVGNRERGACIAETLCPFINFFCSEEDLKEWTENNSEYKNGEIYLLSDALEHGRIIFGDFLK